MHSSTLINPTDSFVNGPTPANNDYHWYDLRFLSTPHNDTESDASTTGQRILPQRRYRAALGRWGTRRFSNLTADGQINLNLDGPTALALSARIVGRSRRNLADWHAANFRKRNRRQRGIRVRLCIGRPYSTLLIFQNYINLSNGDHSTYTLNPQEAGFYYVYLTATSADRNDFGDGLQF